MTLATVITSLSQILAVTALVGRMPISYYFFGVIIQFVMTLGIRFAYRFVLLLVGKVREPEAPLKHVLLVGAGAAGQMILRDIKHAGTVKEKFAALLMITRINGDVTSTESRLRVDVTRSCGYVPSTISRRFM